MSWDSLTRIDLGRYRVLYAAAMLLMLPSFTWLADYPDALYQPPPGPFRLLDGFPAGWVLAGLGLLVAVSMGCLLAGTWVRAASWAATVSMLVGHGLSYSLGKIDHNLLVVVTPVVMLAAGWAPGSLTRPWVLRLWAFTIGTAMLTAGLSKLFGGWLDPSSHAVQGYVFQQVYAFDLTQWLGRPMTHVAAAWVWEPMDWAAVVLECSVVILAVLGLRWFRLGIALLALFHLGVMLMLNISFAGSVIVYAAFIPWGSLRVTGIRPTAPVGVTGGILAWLLVERFGNAAELVRPALLIGGAAVGMWWLVHSVSGVVAAQSSRVEGGAEFHHVG